MREALQNCLRQLAAKAVLIVDGVSVICRHKRIARLRLMRATISFMRLRRMRVGLVLSTPRRGA